MIEEIDIQLLIPQKPPFVMVGKLITCDAQTTCTRFYIPSENVLVFNGELSEAGLIENMAQTAAAGAGYMARQANQPVASIGYIGAIKNLEINALPKIGTTIDTETVITGEVLGVTIVTGTAKCDGLTLASCEMKIYNAG
jgi:predicted hotdog family 3-hydroxylacyl-ACP dehydratase